MQDIEITDELLNFIAVSESSDGQPKLKAYPDVDGWAIGLGRNFNEDGTRVKEGDTTTHMAEMGVDGKGGHFRRDVRRHAEGVIKGLTRDLSNAELYPLVDAAFQNGISAVKNSKYRKALDRGDIEQARIEFDGFNKVRNTKTGKLEVSQNSVERRARAHPYFDTALDDQVRATSQGNPQVAKALVESPGQSTLRETAREKRNARIDKFAPRFLGDHRNR